MPVPCCEFCYRKYINEDGTIDHDRYTKAQVEHLEWQESRGISEEKQTLPTEICRCDCHRDGKAIMH
jgi:hypothetical protein